MGDSQEMKYCSNCKRDIAAANFVMHEVHCRRNIILCKHCSEPVPRTEIDDHYEEYHVEVACDLCNKSVEKQKLDEHKDECPKRQVNCVYCEISLPFCDLKDHLEYCGTRTEPCVRCGQFIMHKDLQRHEDSNCSYPEPKPANNNQAAVASVPRARGGLHDRLLDDPHPPGFYNNFAMNELERILNDPSVSGAGRGRGAAIPRVSNPINSSSSRARPHIPTTRTSGVTGTKRTTVKKTNNSSQRNTGAAGTSSSDTRASHRPDGQDDMDHLLAMHLAHDLGDEDLPPVHDTNENAIPTVSNTNGDHGSNSLDQTTLPCEFCGDLLPIDVLIQHQATCLGGDGIPVANVNLNPEPADLDEELPNNSPSRTGISRTERPQDPPIVDNLSYLAAHDWLSNPSEEFADDILLPCEFCDVLFPEDLLIQHQAVCDANRAQTPRIRSPGARSGARIAPTTRARDTAAAARAVAPPKNRLARRQNDPSFVFMGDDPDSPTPSRARANPSRARPKPRQPMYSNRGSSIGSYGQNAQSKPAPRNAAKNTGRGAEADDSRPGQRRRGSAAKVRQTLDDFIDDPMGNHGERPWSSSTFTVEDDKHEKSTKNSRIQQRDRTGGGASGRTNGASGRASGASTYTSTFTASNVRPAASRKPKPVPRTNFRADFDAEEDNLRVRNGSRDAGSSNSRTKKRNTSNRRGRQPEGDV